MNKWDARFLDMTKLVSGWSKDPSTGVGCAITHGKEIISVGFNGLIKGIPDNHENLHDRDRKLLLTEHAEMNALDYASRSVVGGTLYCTHPVCARCAVRVAKKGIARVVALPPDPKFVDRWRREMEMTDYIFNVIGVEYEFFKGEDE